MDGVEDLGVRWRWVGAEERGDGAEERDDADPTVDQQNDGPEEARGAGGHGF